MQSTNSLASLVKQKDSFDLFAKVCFFLYLAFLAAIVFKRIAYGVDLTDESYYAAFIDEWLKGGLRNTHNLMLHQTAALMVYPFAYLYQFFHHSEEGLIYFLRIIYVFMAFGSMLTLYFFIKKIQSPVIAALIFGFGVLFIPWSIPAPSYNTIGMFGILAALSLFGITILNRWENRKSTGTAVFSALLWTMAIFGYPTLIIAFLGFTIFAFIFLPKERRFLAKYLFFCAIFFCCALALLVFAFGRQHLLDIFQFSNAALHVVGGTSEKLALAKTQFFKNPLFAGLSILALVCGVLVSYLKKKYIPFLTSLISAIIVYLFFFSQPILFLPSHDVIFIAALFGIYIPLTALRTSAAQSTFSLVNVLYCSSIFAGIMTAASATNVLFNFPVGGLLSACLSLTFLYQRDKECIKFWKFFSHLIPISALILSCFGMGYIAFKYIYGEAYGNPFLGQATKLQKSVFAGLWTVPSQAEFIDKLLTFADHNQKEKKKLVVIGRLPGIYLLSHLSPLALSTWYGTPTAKALSLISEDYVLNKDNILFVLRVTDPWSSPLNKAERLLIANYPHRQKYALNNGVMYKYEK